MRVACCGKHILTDFANLQAEDVTPTKLTTMAMDITNGLAYLAEMKFVHRYVRLQ